LKRSGIKENIRIAGLKNHYGFGTPNNCNPIVVKAVDDFYSSIKYLRNKILLNRNQQQQLQWQQEKERVGKKEK